MSFLRANLIPESSFHLRYTLVLLPWLNRNGTVSVRCSKDRRYGSSIPVRYIPQKLGESEKSESFSRSETHTPNIRQKSRAVETPKSSPWLDTPNYDNFGNKMRGLRMTAHGCAIPGVKLSTVNQKSFNNKLHMNDKLGYFTRKQKKSKVGRRKYWHTFKEQHLLSQMQASGILYNISCKWYQLPRRYIHAYGHSEESILLLPNLQHPFKDWQDKRLNKLTASTFGGAIGLWPKRRVQLWLEKLGLVEPFKPNIAICWNNIKEEDALKRYEILIGNQVSEPPEFVVYDKKNHQNNWLAASPDYLLDWENGGVLEIKCPFTKGDMSKVLPWKRIPLYYMPQAQGLLEITDRDWLDFFVWTCNGSSLFRVHRDQKYWAILRKALSDFWWNHVEPAKKICEECCIKKPLNPMYLDLRLLKLKPKARHELHHSIVLQSKLLVDRSNLLFWEKINRNPRYRS